MKTVCALNQCAGCMACVDICPKGAVTIVDRLSAYNAVIDADRCIGCNACHAVCQHNHPAKQQLPAKWYQGWALEPELRNRCASGGLATAVSEAFVEAGGVVCSCTFKDGQFVFAFAETKGELQKFSGSKYVKSNPVGMYKKVKQFLQKGRKVLFAGLPCQVSAMKNYMGEQYAEQLYTADLICHGTPSPKILEIFLNQYGCSLAELQDIRFRAKAESMTHADHKAIVPNGVCDKYSIAFLHSLIYTENCYSCPYARKERVSDLTLGDSWGTDLPKEQQRRGISLILAQTKKGAELLKMANICLEDVDMEKAIKSNHQLYEPSHAPETRNSFFKGIGENRKFNHLVFGCFPKICLKQDVKFVLNKAGLRIMGDLNYGIMIKMKDQVE